MTIQELTVEPSYSIYNSHKPIVIATHNGSFHADDVFGVAVLQIAFPNNTIVRTRDQAQIEAAHFAVDVGGVWDAERGRFDHHQKGFSGARANGTVYASAGLVWAEYGRNCLYPWREYITEAERDAIVQSIDEELVQHLDRADTGAAQGAPGLFGLSALVSQFNPTWIEAGQSGTDKDNLFLLRFMDAVGTVKTFLKRILADKVSEAVAANTVRQAKRLCDGKVLLLEGSGLPWINVVVKEMPDVLFVLYPDSSDRQFQIRTVPVEPESFTARADLPAAWAGLRDADLAAVCGVADAAFCHNGRFIGGAYSCLGALRMAELALEQLKEPT